MQRFILKIAMFLAPVLLILYPLDLLLSRTIKQTSLAQGEYEVWNDILNASIQADVAIYGSSRAWVHIDPQALEDSLNQTAYNFGVDGQNLWLQMFRHHQYMLYNPTPKTIIHSLDVFTMGPKGGKYNNGQFLPYILWNSDFTVSPYFPEIFNKYDYCVPMLRYRNRYKLIISSMLPASRKGTMRNRGFASQTLTWNRDFEEARKNRDSYEVKIDPATVALFKDYLEDCRQKGIEVILVYSPEYIEGQQYIKNRDELLNTYIKLANEYNLHFLDYSDHELSLHKKYFYNATHLNATGADLFSRTLAHDLKQLN